MNLFKKTIFLSLLAMPSLAMAATLSETVGLEEFGGQTKLVQSETNVTIAGVINVLLSTLTMIFTVLIIYSGFKWMTAAGNTEQVSEAKNVIKNSVIGLVIVLSSYVITRAVLKIIAGRRRTVL